MSTDAPGAAPGRSAGEAPGHVPGGPPGHVPGGAPGRAPGGAPGRAPGVGSGRAADEVAAHAGGVPVAVVPTAPLLLASVSPRQPVEIADAVERLRAAVTATLEALPEPPLLIAVAGGPRTAVHLAARIDRAGSGHPHAVTTLPVDADLALELAADVDLHVVTDDVLAGDLGVLAALVAAVHPTTPLLAVTVAADAGTDTRDLPTLARDLGDWAGARAAAVVVAGDLAATREVTSPGYLVDGAVAFDGAVVEALRAGDAAALAALGPEEAERVDARGWAALVVGATIAAAPFAAVELVAPRGVGQVVARAERS